MINNNIGFYGKLPFASDFLRLGMHQTFLDKWQHWLTPTIEHSQQLLGKDYWLNYYLKSPIWYFLFTPKFIDTSGYIGLMIPSVDAVGQYYPFMIYAELIDAENTIALADIDAWLSETRSVALQILEKNDHCYDTLVHEITTHHQKFFTYEQYKDKKQHNLNAILLKQDNQNSTQQLTHLCYALQLSNHNSSFWWCTGSNSMSPSSIISDGLPDASMYLTMLDGKNKMRHMNSYTLPQKIMMPETKGIRDTTQPNRYDAYAMTHVGNKRKRNEDSYLCQSSRCLWAVADGMGGHSKGNMASNQMIQALFNIPLSDNFDHNMQRMIQAIKHTNESLYQYTDQTIGTTIAILHLFEQKALCIWVGDSRIYRVNHQDKLEQITIDHCVDDNENSHILTRAIGPEPDVEIDSLIIDTQTSDRFLICSDGIYNELSHSQIEATITHRLSTKHTCESLVQQVLETQAKDNLTAIMIDSV